MAQKVRFMFICRYCGEKRFGNMFPPAAGCSKNLSGLHRWDKFDAPDWF